MTDEEDALVRAAGAIKDALDVQRRLGCCCEPDVALAEGEDGTLIPVFSHDSFCPLPRSFERPVIVDGFE